MSVRRQMMSMPVRASDAVASTSAKPIKPDLRKNRPVPSRPPSTEENHYEDALEIISAAYEPFRGTKISMDRISQGLPPVKAAPSPSPTSAPRRRPKIRGETLAQFIQRPTVTFPRRFSSTMTHAAIASLGARQPALELDQSARAAVRAAPTTVQAQAAAASALGISFPAIPPLEDPLLGFMTNLIMKDGKKTVARSTVDLMLSTIRLHTHQDPLPLVRLAVERVCPMVRIVSRKKGAKNVLSPVALNERQRVRRGILWLLVASDSKNDKALGRRMAAEVIAILNGNSSALNKRQEAHRSAVLNRSNAR